MWQFMGVHGDRLPDPEGIDEEVGATNLIIRLGNVQGMPIWSTRFDEPRNMLVSTPTLLSVKPDAANGIWQVIQKLLRAGDSLPCRSHETVRVSLSSPWQKIWLGLALDTQQCHCNRRPFCFPCAIHLLLYNMRMVVSVSISRQRALGYRSRAWRG